MIPANLISALLNVNQMIDIPPLSAQFVSAGTTLLIKTRGEAGTATNSAIKDYSPNNRAVTNVGGVLTAFSPYAAYGSVYFDRSSSLNFDGGIALSTLGGDYTLECFVNIPLLSDGHYWIVDGRNQAALEAHSVGLYALSGNVKLRHGTVGYTSTSNVPTNTWVHIALTRKAGLIRMFINGVLDASTITRVASSSGDTVSSIGASAGGAPTFLGSISNLRVVSGNALYTETFVPPTEALTVVPGTRLLTCQSNRFVNAVDNVQFTTVGSPVIKTASPVQALGYSDQGSVYLDGSSHFRTGGINISISGNYAIELWFYPLGTTGRLINNRGNTSPYNAAPDLYIGNGSLILEFAANASQLRGVGVIKNQWNHAVILRLSGITYLMLNGKKIAQDSSYSTVTSGVFAVGALYANSAASDYFKGYVADVRVTLGTAVVYPSTGFIPTTTPLTSDSKPTTDLLLSTKEGRILDVAGGHGVQEDAGSVSIDITGSKSGNGSLVFANSSLKLGRDDGLILPGDFTIECWIKPSEITLGGYNGVLSNFINRVDGDGGFVISAGDYEFPGKYGFRAYLQPAVTLISSSNVITGVWSHVAVVRSSGVIRLYINGVVEATSVPTNLSIFGSWAGNNYWYVGRQGNTGTGPASTYKGSIEDIRVTKRALYTSNFVPQSPLV